MSASTASVIETPWMRWNVGTKLATGFGAAVAIFTIVGLVAYQSTTQLVEAGKWREHTYEVLVTIERVGAALKAMEAAQRGYLLTADDTYMDPYQKALTDQQRAVQRLRAFTGDNVRQQRRLDRLDPMLEERIRVAGQVIDVRRKDGLQAGAQALVAGGGKELSDRIAELLNQMADEENELLARRVSIADASTHQAQLTIAIGTALALVLAALAGLLITRNIAQPLRHLTGLAERIRIGDLKGETLPSRRMDEVGVLSRTFERMTEFLRSVSRGAEQIAVGDLRTAVTPQSDQDVLGHAFVRMSANLREQLTGLVQGANVLGSSASQIVASTSQLAASAAESAAAVSQTTTTVEEVRQTAQMTTQKARMVSDSAQKVAQISLSGRAATESMIAGMTRIRQQMEAIATSMMRLSEQGHAIGLIIAAVEDLAGQSNLLAVNAAIEAAKAGEQGKGFGVVAQEIKVLAEQSRKATEQVRTMLSEIQKATAAAVMATEQGTKAVEAGAAQTAAASDSIQSLSVSVSDAAQAATQIAASSQQQLVGMDQVAAAMTAIKQASAQNVASARELEVAARNLDDLGRSLKSTVERYTL